MNATITQGDLWPVSALRQKLAAGADVDTLYNGDGQAYKSATPLTRACEAGLTETVDTLLAAGANPRVPTHTTMRTALHVAAENANAPRALLERLYQSDPGALEIKDVIGRTPLQAACGSGNLRAISCLTEAGADANVTDLETKGCPVPLIHAVLFGGYRSLKSYEIARVLLAAGADPDTKNAAGATVLFLAVGDEDSDEVRDFILRLLAAGADINARCHEQRTPLHQAAERGHRGIVSVLLAAGADVTALDSSGRTPGQLAGASEHGEIAELLDATERKHVADSVLSAPALPGAPGL